MIFSFNRINLCRQSIKCKMEEVGGWELFDYEIKVLVWVEIYCQWLWFIVNYLHLYWEFSVDKLYVYWEFRLDKLHLYWEFRLDRLHLYWEFRLNKLHWYWEFILDKLHLYWEFLLDKLHLYITNLYLINLHSIYFINYQPWCTSFL
jgi:hypothetical protein